MVSHCLTQARRLHPIWATRLTADMDLVELPGSTRRDVNQGKRQPATIGLGIAAREPQEFVAPHRRRLRPEPEKTGGRTDGRHLAEVQHWEPP